MRGAGHFLVRGVDTVGCGRKLSRVVNAFISTLLVNIAIFSTLKPIIVVGASAVGASGN